jgi:hypothetical protein
METKSKHSSNENHPFFSEFLALQVIEQQLIEQIEHHIDQLSFSQIKLLIKYQKNVNSVLVKMVAKASSDKTRLSAAKMHEVEDLVLPKDPDVQLME